MSERERRLLILLADLTPDGMELGPKSIARLFYGAQWAKRFGYEVCVAATFSPKHPGQVMPMSTMAHQWLKKDFPELTVHDITGDGSFNTRGEFGKFKTFASEAEAAHLAVASAWWHIPRAKKIFQQMFGKDLKNQVHFEGLPAHITLRDFCLEAGKNIFMYLPEKTRSRIEKVIRSRGYNPSW